MINDRAIDQAANELRGKHGGTKESYFALLYLEQEHGVPREKALHQVAFDTEYGIDAFHYDAQRRNLYLLVTRNSDAYGVFKTAMQAVSEALEVIFGAPEGAVARSRIHRQLQGTLVENRAAVEQVYLRFVFMGDPEEAEKSPLVEKYREELESRKYLVDQFFGRDVGLVVEFRSATGKVGAIQAAKHQMVFDVELDHLIKENTSGGEAMHIGFLPLTDLDRMHVALGSRFFDHNIRYGLGESEAVNRAIGKALRAIILDRTEDPSVFAFNHNGITLFAERVVQQGDRAQLTSPRLLNGAQTVTTLRGFLQQNQDNPVMKSASVKRAYEGIRVLCKVITDADQKFITRVTINNNRQNPVEPWNLHANDDIQLELQDKFRDELAIYYERQENAFDQLGSEDLEEYGIQENKAIQMLKLTQTFLLTDGLVSRLSQMRHVFEDDRLYEQVFRRTRLRADARHVLLCYKVQFRLRKLANDIAEKGQNKYAFVSRARNLLWALLCQGLLNDDELADIAAKHGRTLAMANEFTDKLSYLATARVRPLLSDLMEDRDYAAKVAEDNLSFLRTDRAFEKAMDNARKRFKWEHEKLA